MMEKYKGVTIGVLTLFLLVNTYFFWETWPGIFSIPLALVLVGAFLGLSILTIIQALICLFRERFANRNRLFHTTISSTALVAIFLYPFGMLNKEFFRGRDLLVASREGAANCTTTFSLKAGGTYYVRSICFGVTETGGTYKCENDTIWFEEQGRAAESDERYEFAVVRPADSNEPYSRPTLIRFKDRSDTVGHELTIRENHLGDFK